MSARCTAAVFDRYPVSAGGEFKLALALADNAHEDGTHIFPSVETMAAKSRQSVRSVQRNLARMRARGWLIIVKHAGGGRGRAVEYRINPEWIKGAHLAPFIDPEKGCQTEHERVPNEALKGAIGDIAYITRGTPIEPIPPTPTSGGEGALEALIAEYPADKVDRYRAMACWRKIDPDEVTQLAMIDAVRGLLRTEEWKREGGRYVPRLSKWLRNRRWLDPIEQQSPAPAPMPEPTPQFTSEQMKVNKEKAAEALKLARKILRPSIEGGKLAGMIRPAEAVTHGAH